MSHHLCLLLPPVLGLELNTTESSFYIGTGNLNSYLNAKLAPEAEMEKENSCMDETGTAVWMRQTELAGFLELSHLCTFFFLGGQTIGTDLIVLVSRVLFCHHMPGL